MNDMKPIRQSQCKRCSHYKHQCSLEELHPCQFMAKTTKLRYIMETIEKKVRDFINSLTSGEVVELRKFTMTRKWNEFITKRAYNEKL